MKLQKLQIDESHLSLHCELEASELRSVLELFPEVAAVASLVKDGTYQVMVGDEFVPAEPRLPVGAKASHPTRVPEKPKTPADEFVERLLEFVEKRGDWVENGQAPEPRFELTLAAPFYVNGIMRPELIKWRELIEEQTKGIENPAIAAVALCPKKPYDLAETAAEREEKKNQAVATAFEELKTTAYRFYHKTLSEEHLEEQEGASQ